VPSRSLEARHPHLMIKRKKKEIIQKRTGEAEHDRARALSPHARKEEGRALIRCEDYERVALDPEGRRLNLGEGKRRSTNASSRGLDR